jgi:hypothetical protein
LQHNDFRKPFVASGSGSLAVSYDDQLRPADPLSRRCVSCKKTKSLILPLPEIPEPVGGELGIAAQRWHDRISMSRESLARSAPLLGVGSDQLGPGENVSLHRPLERRLARPAKVRKDAVKGVQLVKVAMPADRRTRSAVA